MAYNQDPQTAAHAQQYETFLVLGMVRVGVFPRALVIEDGLSFLKGDAMFAPVGAVLLLVPNEAQLGYDYIVCISAIQSTVGIRGEQRGVALRVRHSASSGLESGMGGLVTRGPGRVNLE